LLASEPENVSYPLRAIEKTITPPDRFFVRDHFAPPEISIEDWRLRIEGRVEHPCELTFSDLVESPSRQLESVLECAGNAAGGAAVSNGLWEGVSMAWLLERARPSSNAAFVMLEGADSGRLFEDTQKLPYTQQVPIAKCQEPESMVAFKLNNLMLPARNGFPARALLPGWYGMNSVKWLRRIVVLGQDEQNSIFHQSGMTRLYNRVTRDGASDTVTRLSAIQIKSTIAWPGSGARLPKGRHTIWGFAWGGNSPVRKMSVSVDGGKIWNSAEFQAASNRFSWVRWSYRWDATPGDYVLMSRAADGNGTEQPLRRDRTRKDSYELNWCAPLPCKVG
jgi:DMSO/TMAO reductase YedYZ molybdopterin-dependent catalytic subunit